VTPIVRPHSLALLPCCYPLAALLLLCSPMVTGFSRSQQSPPLDPAASATISVNAELVALPVRVTDSNGNVVSGLTLQDFTVLEEQRKMGKKDMKPVMDENVIRGN